MALAESRFLPSLKSLDLSFGAMTDAGAQAILDHAEAFTHMHPNLARNTNSQALATELSKRFKRIDVGSQKER